MAPGDYIGTCFIPNNPQKTFESARLVVSEESFELEIPNKDLGYIDREVISGTFNGIGPITFINSTLISGKGGIGGSFLKFRAEYCVDGHFNSPEELLFQEANVFIPALFKWLNIHSIKTDLMFADDKFVKLEEPQEIKVCETNGFILAFIFYYSYNVKTRDGEVTLKEGAGINIKSTSTVRHLREYMDIITNFRKLLFFLTNSDCGVESTVLFQDPESSVKLHTNQFRTFHPSTSLLRTTTYQNLKNNLERIVSIWFNDYRIHISLDLILEKSLNIGLSRESSFLNSCFALETFHRNFQDFRLMPPNEFRRLREKLLKDLKPEETKFVKNKLSHFNSPTFKERLFAYKEDFISLVPPDFDVEKYITTIVRTRNFLVHRSSQKSVFDSFDLLYAAIYIEGILKTQILKFLEVDRKIIHQEYRRMQEDLTTKYRLNRIREPRETPVNFQLKLNGG